MSLMTGTPEGVARVASAVAVVSGHIPTASEKSMPLQSQRGASLRVSCAYARNGMQYKSHSFLPQERPDRRRSSGLRPLHLACSHCLFCCLSKFQCSFPRSPPCPEHFFSRSSPSSHRTAGKPRKLVHRAASGVGNNRGVFVPCLVPSLVSTESCTKHSDELNETGFFVPQAPFR